MAFYPTLWLLIAGLSQISVGGMQLIHDVSHGYATMNPSDQKIIISIKDQTAKEPLAWQESGAVRTSRMVDASGRAYTCKLPVPLQKDQPGGPPAPVPDGFGLGEEDADASSGFLAPGMPVAVGHDKDGTPHAAPVDLLEKLSSLCFFRHEGLWTYEVCYKKHARQYRQNVQRLSVGGVQTQQVAAEDFSCGKYDEEGQDWTVRYDASTTGMPLTYVRHVLADGAPCTMTGAHRSSEVRFTCMPQHTDNLLVMVKEFPTCNYIFVVATPFLCKHPEFRPPPERTHAIHCVPDIIAPSAAENAATDVDEGLKRPPVVEVDPLVLDPPVEAPGGGAGSGEADEGSPGGSEGEGVDDDVDGDDEVGGDVEEEEENGQCGGDGKGQCSGEEMEP